MLTSIKKKFITVLKWLKLIECVKMTMTDATMEEPSKTNVSEKNKTF